MECGGYVCPDCYVNDVTPLEFEELVELFKKFDADGSGAVDEAEMFQMMKKMEMEHSLDQAKEFMNVVDKDGSGQLEFGEFVALIAMVKRGDKSLRGFAKLVDELQSTPSAVLEAEASKRGLKLRYCFVERREATATNDACVIMEVVLTGHWFEAVGTELRESVTDRRFQGIAKTTRDARCKAAEAALQKMKKTMPGLKHAAGVLPSTWVDWAFDNIIDRGADMVHVLKTLRLKGFHPWRNPEFMQRILLLDDYDRFLHANHGPKTSGPEQDDTQKTTPTIRYYKNAALSLQVPMKPMTKLPMTKKVYFAVDDPWNKRMELQKLAPTLKMWIQNRLEAGFDGELILKVLEMRSNPLSTLPEIVQKIRRNKGGRAIDVMKPQLIGFDLVCEKNWADAARLFLAAGQDPNVEIQDSASQMKRTPLMIAALHGSAEVIEILVADTCDVDSRDAFGRTALHLAAATADRADVCRLLVDAGADVHALDNCFDTPLHCAARNNRSDTCDVLATFEEQFVRDVVSGVRKLPDNKTEFREIFHSCFARFMATKLRETELRHFKKAWIYEAALDCYENELDDDMKKFVTKPVFAAVENVLQTLDSDKESGFIHKANLDDGVVVETWIATIADAEHLVELLKLCFLYSAIQTTNHLGRTALHEACFANKSSSHEATIRVLIDKHVCNLDAVDDRDDTARDLILTKRHRPQTPSGQPLREDLVDERREQLLKDYNDTMASIEEAKSRERQRKTFDIARKSGSDDLDQDNSWSLLKAMSHLKRCFAGIEEYEDSDTMNRYYRWDPKAADKKNFAPGEDQTTKSSSTSGTLQSAEAREMAKNASMSFSWDPPVDFLFEERVTLALEHVRRFAKPLRTIGEWTVLRDTRQRDESLLYVSDAIAANGGVGVTPLLPASLKWHRLHKTAISTGYLGANDEWAVLQTKEGVTFYYKAATGEYRWNRPVDAIEKSDARLACTNVAYNGKRVDQVWYTCDECNEKLADRGIRLTLCLHCARHCHQGHRGLRYVRKSKIACSCARLCPAGTCLLACDAENDSHLKEQRMFAKAEAAECKRRSELALTPSILAQIPPPARPEEHDQDGKISGWALCKRVPDTDVVDGWQILIDPTQYDYLLPGTRVLVDRNDVIGCKISGVVREVGRKPNDDLVYAIQCEVPDDEDHSSTSEEGSLISKKTELRKDVFRSEIISVDARTFYWNADLAKSTWDPPEEVLPETAEVLEAQLEQWKAPVTIESSEENDEEEEPEITPVDIKDLSGVPALALTAERILNAKKMHHQKKEKPTTPVKEEAPQTPSSEVTFAATTPSEKKIRSFDDVDPETEVPGGDKTPVSRATSATSNKSRATTAASEKASVEAIGEFDSIFRPRNRDQGGANVDWPTLTGPEWDDLAANHARLLRYMDDWEEYEHVRTQSRFWRDTWTAQQEAAIRRMQRVYRQRHFRTPPRCWYSQAYFWTKPQAVTELERDRNGWAVLRRRSDVLRECKDVDGRRWEEFLDPVSGELFYHLPFSGFSQWLRPNLAKHQDDETTDSHLAPLEQGDDVMFRFPEDVADTVCVIVQVHQDDHEDRLYDIAPTVVANKDDATTVSHASSSVTSPGLLTTTQEYDSSRIQRNIPRHRLRRRPLTHIEVEQYREERQWRLQLRRARDADDREKRRRDAETQAALFSTKPAMTKAEDVARARQRRAAAEAAVLETAAKERAEAERKAAVMAGAKDQGIDVRALKAQQAGISILRVNDNDSELEKLESDVEATRKRILQERKDREQAIADRAVDDEVRLEWLAKMEDKTTTPRSIHRRRVLRLLYRAKERQQSGFVICEWGCGEWMKIGRQKLFHEKESCVMRVLPCCLGCPLKLREEQWVAIQTTGDRMMTYQEFHERSECGRRLVPCDRRCGEWVAADDLEDHLLTKCIKRPMPELVCRLGCGAVFKGNAVEVLQCEARRIEHEQEMCEERMVQCTNKHCAVSIKAKDRQKHRQLHILRANVTLFVLPGVYSYKVPPATRQLKIQLWGGGGGSGFLRDHVAGSGGGGAYVEALVMVIPGECLQITVGAGGQGGVCGRLDMPPDESTDSLETLEMIEVVGVALGGEPGGGNGHGGNEQWAAGGGGGYSMVMRYTRAGSDVLLVASGGGGGGSRDGVAGGGLEGELPGTRIDKRNGRMGTSEAGGKAGDSGEAALCSFPSEDGRPWQGGAGSQFGAGGGGGIYGGGGGGTSPGIAGGGGGGASFVDVAAVQDFKVLQATGALVAGNAPYACGLGEWDFSGRLAGSGADASISHVSQGHHGAVRITRPGFYNVDPSPLQPLHLLSRRRLSSDDNGGTLGASG